MTIQAFTAKLKQYPETISFQDTMAVIEANYTFTPTGFTNGTVTNAEGQNSGSCKLYAFAKLQQFTPEETLACFGEYYRKDVLENPKGEDHQNIRNFMNTGWEGISFDQLPLQ